MTDSDDQLLRSFAANRDEDAFRLLAKRHFGLVFHTALRRCGNRPMAEEIGQNVLLAMARKAAVLAKQPGRLPAWLHRATLFEANKAMRAESAYQRRKQQEQEPAAADLEEADRTWREALPHLDLALDKLPESDRQVLLLHYFEEHPFSRIGELLGRNAATVQKQARRALEKLSRILRTKGIALSVTALGAGLATQTAKAVPEALVHSASSFALCGSTPPNPSFVTSMIASKPKVIIPLALLLLATPLVLQQLAIAREKDHLRSLHETLASSNKTSTPSRVSRFRSTEISNSLDVMVLAKEQAEAKRIGGEVMLDYQAKLAALEPAVLVELIRKTSAAPLGLQKKSGLSGALVAALAETDPKLAVTTAIDALGGPGAPQARMVAGSDLGIHLASWAQSDPAGALAWLREQTLSPKFSSRALSDDPRSSSHIDSLKPPLFAALVTSQAPQADEFLRSTPEAERSALILESIRLLYRQGGEHWLGPYLRIVRDLAPEDSRENILEQLALNARREGLLRMLGSAQASPEETEKLAGAIIREELSKAQTRQWQSGGKTPPADLSSITAWLQQIVPGHEKDIIARCRDELDQERAEFGAKVVSEMRTVSGLPDQQVASMLMKHDLSDHLPEALDLAEQIKDPELKQKTIEHLKSAAKHAEAP